MTNSFLDHGVLKPPAPSSTSCQWPISGVSPERSRERIWKYLHFEDFLAFHLARVPALDFSMASRSMAFDPLGKDWIPAILDFAGIDRGHLGNVTPAGVPVGIVRASLTEEWGISRNALLISGGHNQCMAAIGAGVIEPHLACYSIGTAEVIGTCVASPQTSPSLLESNFPCYCHVVDDHYFTITLNQSGGLAMEWLQDSLLKLGVSDVDDLEGLNDGIRVWPLPVLFLPHLVGSGTPSCDHFSRAAFVGLSLKSDRTDLLQAVVDAQALEARLNVEALARSDIEITDLRAVDRGARMWKALQVKATVLQRPIHTLRSPEAALMGAAMLAQTAIGVFEDIGAARDECVCVASTIEPACPRAASTMRRTSATGRSTARYGASINTGEARRTCPPEPARRRRRCWSRDDGDDSFVRIHHAFLIDCSSGNR